jgi:hypothetical protein
VEYVAAGDVGPASGACAAYRSADAGLFEEFCEPLRGCTRPRTCLRSSTLTGIWIQAIFFFFDRGGSLMGMFSMRNTKFVFIPNFLFYSVMPVDEAPREAAACWIFSGVFLLLAFDDKHQNA